MSIVKPSNLQCSSCISHRLITTTILILLQYSSLKMMSRNLRARPRARLTTVTSSTARNHVTSLRPCSSSSACLSFWAWLSSSSHSVPSQTSGATPSGSADPLLPRQTPETDETHHRTAAQVCLMEHALRHSM